MRVLVSNDDGIRAPGINALARALRSHPGISETWVVAPDRERSAVSHAISLHQPLRLAQVDERSFAVDGTPTDAVYLALHHVLPEPPDLVISGINLGANLGNDVMYSGTVAAAMEGAMFGHAAVAISLANGESAITDEEAFTVAAQVGCSVAMALRQQPLVPGVVLNVNVPHLPADAIKGRKLCRLGYNDWSQVVTARTDPRGRSYFWIGGERSGRGAIPDSDYDGIDAGFVTLTPLHYDLTDHRSFAAVRQIELSPWGKTEDALGDEPLSHPVLRPR